MAPKDSINKIEDSRCISEILLDQIILNLISLICKHVFFFSFFVFIYLKIFNGERELV